MSQGENVSEQPERRQVSAAGARRPVREPELGVPTRGDPAAVSPAGTPGSGPERRVSRRRRLPGGRPHNLRVRLSEAEYESVQSRAGAAGLSVAAYLAAAAEPRGPLGVTHMPAEERRAWASELMAVRRLVAAVGNNVNQLARAANSGAAVDPDEVRAVLEACDRVVTRTATVLDQLGAGRR
jgi:Bacterial mobilisation protein (MobC)